MAENKGVENKQSKKDSKERKPKILGLKPKGAAQWYKAGYVRYERRLLGS